MVAAKNSVINIVVNKIIYTGRRHDEFWKIFLKLDLRVCDKVYFSIF